MPKLGLSDEDVEVIAKVCLFLSPVGIGLGIWASILYSNSTQDAPSVDTSTTITQTIQPTLDTGSLNTSQPTDTPPDRQTLILPPLSIQPPQPQPNNSIPSSPSLTRTPPPLPTQNPSTTSGGTPSISTPTRTSPSELPSTTTVESELQTPSTMSSLD